MSCVGIITEYNPFHNGHRYHIEKAKELSQADTVLCVMSGNFVQRGEPAVIDKYVRTHMALKLGVDLLCELPFYYACASAETFAYGAVHTLAQLGANYLCFGSECGDIDLLTTIAGVLADEPEELSLFIQEKSASGVTFPVARMQALLLYFKKHQQLLNVDCKTLDSVLKSPNNILGIEYVKIIIRDHLSLIPLTVTRAGSAYHEIEINGSMPSATSIRSLCEKAADWSTVSKMLSDSVPDVVLHELTDAYHKTFPVSIDDFTPVLNASLYQMLHLDKDVLLTYTDLTPSLVNRIQNYFTGFLSFSAFTMQLKSRELTYARVSRCLLHCITAHTTSLYHKYMSDGIPYIRILGFTKAGQAQLSIVKKHTDVTLITKPAAYKELLSEDIYASDLYRMIVFQKYGTQLPAELTHSPIRL